MIAPQLPWHEAHYDLFTLTRRKVRRRGVQFKIRLVVKYNIVTHVLYVYVCMYVCKQDQTRCSDKTSWLTKCVNVCMFAYMYVCVYIYMYTNTYWYLYRNIHTHT